MIINDRNMKRKIVGIGETVLDIVFKEGKPQAAVPGGSTFNAMISLGRTSGVLRPEIPVLMVTQTGDDMVGEIVTSFMAANNVLTEAVNCIPGTQTTVSLAMLNENNDARYEFFRDKSGTSDSFADIQFNAGDLVVFGSFFAVDPALRDYTRRQMRAAHDAGAVIYYDINYRKNHLADLPATIDNIEENCAMSDFVRGSSEDIACIYGSDNASGVYEKHIAPLCPNFICTHGSGPVEVFSPGIHAVYKTARVKTVSTVGAGDNFNAGFVFGLIMNDMGKPEASGMTEKAWGTLVRTAKKFSAEVCRSIYNYVGESFYQKLV